MEKINGKSLRVAIGKNLSKIRNARKEKQTETAEALNIHPSVISRIQKGNYDSLTLEQLVQLCNHFHVSLQHVMGIEGKLAPINTKNSHPNISLPALKDAIGSGYLLYINDLKAELEHYKNIVGTGKVANNM